MRPVWAGVPVDGAVGEVLLAAVPQDGRRGAPAEAVDPEGGAAIGWVAVVRSVRLLVRVVCPDGEVLHDGVPREGEGSAAGGADAVGAIGGGLK